MSALKPKHYEWEPKDVQDDDVWRTLARKGTKPEDLPKKQDQMLYRAYLKRMEAAETEK